MAIDALRLRLAHLTVALQSAEIQRGAFEQEAQDATMHPRGADGRFIGGDSMALARHLNVLQKIQNYHLAHADLIGKRQGEAARQAHMQSIRKPMAELQGEINKTQDKLDAAIASAKSDPAAYKHLTQQMRGLYRLYLGAHVGRSGATDNGYVPNIAYSRASKARLDREMQAIEVWMRAAQVRKVGYGITGEERDALRTQIEAIAQAEAGAAVRATVASLRARLAQVYRRGTPVYGAGHHIIGNVGNGEAPHEKEGLRTLAIHDVVPNPDQPRKSFDQGALQELAQSIKEHGLLQPITVRPTADGKYQLIAGERRWRASQLAGKTDIPALVIHATDQQVRELALIENINRQDMTMGETARAYKGLLDGGMSLKDLQAKTGKTAGSIQQHLDYLTLEPHLQSLVDSGKLRTTLVSDLAKLSAAGREEAAQRILDGDLSVKGSKQVIAAISQRENQLTMFTATSAAPTKAQTDAATKYQTAIDSMTSTLAGLDDATMASMAGVIESPAAEAQRLGLMAKQLTRMQAALEAESARRKVSGAPTVLAAPKAKAKKVSAKVKRMQLLGLRQRLAELAA